MRGKCTEASRELNRVNPALRNEQWFDLAIPAALQCYVTDRTPSNERDLREITRRAKEHFPRSPRYAFKRGQALDFIGSRTEAAEEFKAAITLAQRKIAEAPPGAPDDQKWLAEAQAALEWSTKRLTPTTSR